MGDSATEDLSSGSGRFLTAGILKSKCFTLDDRDSAEGGGMLSAEGVNGKNPAGSSAPSTADTSEPRLPWLMLVGEALRMSIMAAAPWPSSWRSGEEGELRALEGCDRLDRRPNEKATGRVGVWRPAEWRVERPSTGELRAPGEGGVRDSEPRPIK